MKWQCDVDHVRSILTGKSVAIVGSGPGVMRNPKQFVDSFDVVVRVNNFKIMGPITGFRTDVFYSYFGNAIRKTIDELKVGGVRLCMCKCPNAQFIESEWHRQHQKMNGVDFRYIYRHRADWWFCPTYVPTATEFVEKFHLLGNHVPTTGFAAILDVLAFNPASVYLTGFDFFASGMHNVNERWRQGNPDDPIGHAPMIERDWVSRNLERYPVTMDDVARAALDGRKLKHNPWNGEVRP